MNEGENSVLEAIPAHIYAHHTPKIDGTLQTLGCGRTERLKGEHTFQVLGLWERMRSCLVGEDNIQKLMRASGVPAQSRNIQTYLSYRVTMMIGTCTQITNTITSLKDEY